MNIDSGKLPKVKEAAGWLQQYEIFYKAMQFELADDCIARAKSALSDPVFDRRPVFQNSREIPATVKIRAAHLPQGYAIINGSDFDASVHEIWEEAPKKRK